MRALTKPWRSLAYLYSAFSDRSPCARAIAISLGRSTFSSWSRWSISSCSFFLIFAIGSDISLHQKRFAGEGFGSCLGRPRAILSIDAEKLREQAQLLQIQR